MCVDDTVSNVCQSSHETSIQTPVDDVVNTICEALIKGRGSGSASACGRPPRRPPTYRTSSPAKPASAASTAGAHTPQCCGSI